MFKIGEKVKISPNAYLHSIVREMIEGKEGTVVEIDKGFWDYVVVIPGSGRDGNRFGFLAGDLISAK